jgi:hypothetical protein
MILSMRSQTKKCCQARSWIETFVLLWMVRRLEQLAAINLWSASSAHRLWLEVFCAKAASQSGDYPVVSAT